MIHIRKPAHAPEVLRTKGKNERRALSVRYTRTVSAVDQSASTFEFKSSIYAHASVKQMLQTTQHGKCCFCESKVTHIAYGDVEHFRPKKGYRQQPSDVLQHPGYYWLAYEWDNLLFVCQLCNQRHKRNLFPLKNPARRARTHKASLRQEEPLFIHPATEDPENHIGFREEIAYAHDGDLRGMVTIEALGLNRPALSERRRDHYEHLRLIHAIASSIHPQAEEARIFLEKAVRDDAEYAAMARAALTAGFRV